MWFCPSPESSPFLGSFWKPSLTAANKERFLYKLVSVRHDALKAKRHWVTNMRCVPKKRQYWQNLGDCARCTGQSGILSVCACVITLPETTSANAIAVYTQRLAALVNHVFCKSLLIFSSLPECTIFEGSAFIRLYLPMQSITQILKRFAVIPPNTNPFTQGHTPVPVFGKPLLFTCENQTYSHFTDIMVYVRVVVGKDAPGSRNPWLWWEKYLNCMRNFRMGDVRMEVWKFWGGAKSGDKNTHSLHVCLTNNHRKQASVLLMTRRLAPSLMLRHPVLRFDPISIFTIFFPLNLLVKSPASAVFLSFCACVHVCMYACICACLNVTAVLRPKLWDHFFTYPHFML